MSICFECGKPINKDDNVKIVGKKIIHTGCARAYMNRINGRPILCDECNGSGYAQKTNSSTISGTRISSNICSKCMGNGYVASN